MTTDTIKPRREARDLRRATGSLARWPTSTGNDIMVVKVKGEIRLAQAMTTPTISSSC
jgi:hypothetical protein